MCFLKSSKKKDGEGGGHVPRYQLPRNRKWFKDWWWWCARKIALYLHSGPQVAAENSALPLSRVTPIQRQEIPSFLKLIKIKFKSGSPLQPTLSTKCERHIRK